MDYDARNIMNRSIIITLNLPAESPNSETVKLFI